MDLVKYMRDRARDAAKLDPETAAILAADPILSPMKTYRASAKVIWLISVWNEEKGSYGGQVSEANPWLASEVIYNGTHRLATEDEIRGEEQRRQQQREEILLEDRARRSNSTVIQVSPDALREAIAGLGIKDGK
jgi:hypothetical protein